MNFNCQQIARVLAPSAGAKAAGIESVKLPFLPEASGGADAVKARLDKAANDFENSDFLKGLKERSEQNREKNKKDIQDKYCYRQAEMGVGDCAGLRLIPGMTKSGLQKEKTPERKFLEFLTGSKDEE
ncbi:g8452 [Coccomyxa elongata]